MPLTFSDTSGHIYEPDGVAATKFEQISTIKAERGARVGAPARVVVLFDEHGDAQPVLAQRHLRAEARALVGVGRRHEPVAHIGERTRHDRRERIAEIALAQCVLERLLAHFTANYRHCEAPLHNTRF